MESETSPDMINEFAENLNNILKDQEVQGKLYDMNEINQMNNEKMSVLIKD